ncbi:hypothetical protein AJ79_06400 [Helicocarpus griseus UAMH5409]|uniref:Asl1-like glycosyl hydrolase catalytic domain-containing protein n=1 Tax=Helicocarpus griseus UAMH5409 TaxID=1447875 RepID=A0A2B7XE45_9EURO|nr:hypothetical protein AJ79_06400 [Helicocarpus griseus UAMH5409]
MVSFKALFASGLLVTAVSAVPVGGYNNTIVARQSADKRGLAYNNAAALLPYAGKKDVFSWAYNWAGSVGGDIFGTEFVPTLWGPKAFGSWKAEAEISLGVGSQHLLAFNEPDLPEQANMSPQEAAEAYQEYMNPYADRARLGSPSVTNGASPMGLGWLEQFFSACGGSCKVDFLNIHWYDSATNVEYFKKHVEDAVSLATSQGIDKIWVSEFQGMGDDATQVKFLEEVLAWLDSHPSVERYAYFMADKLVNGLSLSSVGEAYASA